MLKLLIKKQITETLIRTFRKGSIRHGEKAGGTRKRSGTGTVVVMTLAALYLAAMVTFLAYTLCQPLYSVHLVWLYYLLIGGAAIVFGTFGSVFSTCFTLYMAKDNDLLLSMPIPIRDVILSRLFSVYFMGLLYSGLVSIPAVAVGWFVAGFSLPRLVGGIVFVLLISWIVMGLSCLLGWVVAKISQRLKNRSFLTVLVALVFVGLYYFIYFRFMSRVKDLLGMMFQLGRVIRSSAYPVYIFGRIGEGDWTGMLFWSAGVLLALGLIWLLLKKTFLSISTATPTPKRAAYAAKETRLRSASSALLRKEWYRFSGSANYMLNCGMPLLLMLGFGGYLLINGSEIMTMISSVLWKYPEAVPVLLCAVCCMLSGMVDISTPSISLEGNTIWQAQCLPLTPWQVLRAKLALHLSLAAVPTLFCTVVLMVLVPAALTQRLLMLTVSVFNAVFFAMFGLFLGLKLPNLSWTNEIVPIKQSASVLIAIFSGIGLNIAFIGLYLLFGWHIGATAWLGLFTLLYLAADSALYFWLKGPGAQRFAAL